MKLFTSAPRGAPGVRAPGLLRAALLGPLLFGSVLLSLVSCRREDRGNTPEIQAVGHRPPGFSLAVADVGFSRPWSVLHDPAADVYLVANAGALPATGEPGPSGFISRVSAAGKVLDLKWIGGREAQEVLASPRGMALIADTLFVADEHCLRKFHRVTGEPLGSMCLEQSASLGAVTASPRGDLYFVARLDEEDPGSVYLLRHTADVPQRLVLADGTPLGGPELGGPRGLSADGRGLLVATFGSGELVRVSLRGREIPLLPPSGLELEGVVSLDSLGSVVSSRADSSVYLVDPDGHRSVLMLGLPSPGAPGYDRIRNRVVIPLRDANELRVREVT